MTLEVVIYSGHPGALNYPFSFYQNVIKQLELRVKRQKN